jgi:hypothetical protein
MERTCAKVLVKKTNSKTKRKEKHFSFNRNMHSIVVATVAIGFAVAGAATLRDGDLGKANPVAAAFTTTTSA